ARIGQLGAGRLPRRSGRRRGRAAVRRRVRGRGGQRERPGQPAGGRRPGRAGPRAAAADLAAGRRAVRRRRDPGGGQGPAGPGRARGRHDPGGARGAAAGGARDRQPGPAAQDPRARAAAPRGAARAPGRPRRRGDGGRRDRAGRGRAGDRRPGLRPAGRPGRHHRARGRPAAAGRGGRGPVRPAGPAGHPGTPSLGALGEQGLFASIARARQLAALYRPLSAVPVVPTFEIIATVAQGSPGPDGSYSYETPLSVLRPWVRAASRAGMYVVLDLQPGRDSLLAQAKEYQALLERPNVGLALDPEWALGPGQLPLKQIGSVSIRQVNSVINWLAALTARYRLPQKLLVLHQFRLSMIQGEQRLDTRHDDLAIVIHMDGQGTPADKQQTWDAVTAAAPPGVFFGWKNFLVKDHPML